MFTVIFWKLTAERAVSTAAEAALALITGNGLGVLDVDWTGVLSVSALSALAAVLKALVASQVNDPRSPSLVDETAGRHEAP